MQQDMLSYSRGCVRMCTGTPTILSLPKVKTPPHNCRECFNSWVSAPLAWWVSSPGFEQPFSTSLDVNVLSEPEVWRSQSGCHKQMRCLCCWWCWWWLGGHRETVYRNVIYFSYAAEVECHISCNAAILCQSQAHKRWKSGDQRYREGGISCRGLLWDPLPPRTMQTVLK